MQIPIIQVPDKPHEKIYGRDDAEAMVKKELSKQIELLQDLVNYGTNLIPRCYISSKRETQDTVIIAGLLSHAVSMLDGITVLLRQGAVFPSELLLRSLFESRIAIHWILKKDTKQRATQYHVWHLREELNWTRVAIKGTDENQILNDAFKSNMKGEFAKQRTEREPEAKEQEKKILALLSDPELKSINDEFERLRTPKSKGKRKKHDAHWYALYGGPQSIREMCGQLELSGDYNIFYSSASGVAHATTLTDKVTPQGNDLIFAQIRSLNEVEQIISYTVSNALMVFRTLLEHYRYGELEAFSRKYLRDWQAPYMTIPKVVVGTGNTTFI
jgi:hypothetical protein